MSSRDMSVRALGLNAEWKMVRAMLTEGEVFEIFIDTPLANAAAPANPEIRIDTAKLRPEETADAIIAKLIP